jgi:hypothetical protein
VVQFIQDHLKNDDYEILEAIDLKKDLSLALCLIGSTKPSYHEVREKVLRRNLGHFSIKTDDASAHTVPSYYDVAEKMTVESIQHCSDSLDRHIFEGNLGIVRIFWVTMLGGAIREIIDPRVRRVWGIE